MSIEKLVNGEKEIFANKSVIDHSQLSGTQSYGCHPISAIRKLPEKLTKLKEKDAEIQANITEVSSTITNIENNINNRIDNINTKIEELYISQLQNDTNELGATISNVENKTSKIDIVDNKDTKLIFTNYNGEQKTIQTGALPDEENLTLINNKIALKKVVVTGALSGIGTTEQPLKIQADEKTITNDGILKVIALDNNGNIITGTYIDSEINELNKDIGDLTNTVNNDKKELDAKNIEQDNLIKALQNKTSGLGGYLTAYNFKKSEPTQDELTNYALDQLSLTNKQDIPDQTRVKNLYNDNVWILNNHIQNETAIFNWINDGSGGIAIATDGTLGVVKGSTEDYEGAVDVAGHITINGLTEFIEGINQTLLDTPSLNNENTFSSKNNFNGETKFNTTPTFNKNINLANSLIKILKSINNSDIVTQYDADKIIIEKNGVTYTINLPQENGDIITSNKFNPKHSTIKNEDSQSEKIDSWLTEDADTMLSIRHQNGTTQTNLNISKNYGELGAVEYQEETNKFKSSKLSYTSDTFDITVDDANGNKQTLHITPEGISINNDSIVLLTDLKKELEKKLNKLESSEINRVYVRKENGEDTSLPFTYQAEATSIAMRSPSGTLAVETPTQEKDATNKKYIEENYQKKLTMGNRLTLSEDNRLDVVTNFISLSGESGELHEDEYSMIQRDPMTVLKYGGNYYRLNSEPLNGSGNYIFFCDNYSTGEIEELKPYIIILHQNRQWEWKTIINPNNSVQYIAQSLTQEQKDQVCKNLGLPSSNNHIIIETKETAINGELTSEQIKILQSSDTNYILFNNEKYDKQDIKTDEGYLVYTHKGYDSTNKFFTKCITVTLSTKVWVLVQQTEDDIPTENSKNLITSGGVYEQLQMLNTNKANTNADNINVSNFLNKLNINQNVETIDGTTIITFGNLMLQSKTFSVNGNTTQDFIFPYMYSNSPLCWCNSTAMGDSSNNSVAVTTFDNSGMTIRTCGANTKVTMFAIGIKS